MSQNDADHPRARSTRGRGAPVRALPLRRRSLRGRKRLEPGDDTAQRLATSVLAQERFRARDQLERQRFACVARGGPVDQTRARQGRHHARTGARERSRAARSPARSPDVSSRPIRRRRRSTAGRARDRRRRRRARSRHRDGDGRRASASINACSGVSIDGTAPSEKTQASYRRDESSSWTSPRDGHPSSASTRSRSRNASPASVRVPRSPPEPFTASTRARPSGDGIGERHLRGRVPTRRSSSPDGPAPSLFERSISPRTRPRSMCANYRSAQLRTSSATHRERVFQTVLHDVLDERCSIL